MAKLIKVWDGTTWQEVGPALPNALTIDGTQTLTNKTISGGSNTLTNIGNGSLTNSSITVNGSAVSLGGSVAISAVPSQSTNSGKYLTTDGTIASWATLSSYLAPTLGSTIIGSAATIGTIAGLTKITSAKHTSLDENGYEVDITLMQLMGAY